MALPSSYYVTVSNPAGRAGPFSFAKAKAFAQKWANRLGRAVRIVPAKGGKSKTKRGSRRSHRNPAEMTFKREHDYLLEKGQSNPRKTLSTDMKHTFDEAVDYFKRTKSREAARIVMGALSNHPSLGKRLSKSVREEAQTISGSTFHIGASQSNPHRVGTNVPHDLSHRSRANGVTKTKGLTDAQVLDAFIDRKSAIGKTLSTDGWRLDGHWMGGTGIAVWRDDQINFKDLGSKAAEKVQRKLRKMTPKNLLDSGWTRGSKKNPRPPVTGPYTVEVLDTLNDRYVQRLRGGNTLAEAQVPFDKMVAQYGSRGDQYTIQIVGEYMGQPSVVETHQTKFRDAPQAPKRGPGPKKGTRRNSAPNKYASFVKAQMPHFKHLSPKARMSAIAREWRSHRGAL